MIDIKQKLINIDYFVPAMISLIFYLISAAASGFGSVNPYAWCFVALLFISAVIMVKRKWWGCIGGVITGAVLIYMGTQYTGQVISETPIGIIFCVYYVVLGVLCFKNKKISQ